MDETVEITEFTEEDRRGRRRLLGQQAIALAMQGRWSEAADVNRQIVEMAPGDAEAYNRLGKALTEMGQIVEARQAYEGGLRADPANMIAQRNLERLSRITENEAAEMAKRSGSVKLDPRFFTEETGKTAIIQLQSAAGTGVLATLVAGEQVRLERHESQLVVITMDGTYLGRVEDRLATRMTRLMQTGNEYQAGVVGVDDSNVRIIIRETRQAPQNAGRISFPPQVQTLPRPYLREGLVRRVAGEEDDDEIDLDMGEADDDDEEESGEFGFHETSLDEV